MVLSRNCVSLCMLGIVFFLKKTHLPVNWRNDQKKCKAGAKRAGPAVFFVSQKPLEKPIEFPNFIKETQSETQRSLKPPPPPPPVV